MSPSSPTQALLLGTAQDAGVPQAGCACERCRRAHADPARRRLAVALGLVDHAARQTWLIDATPDFREQLYLLQHSGDEAHVDGHTPYPLAGILLTHAHIGHYSGADPPQPRSVGCARPAALRQRAHGRLSARECALVAARSSSATSTCTRLRPTSRSPSATTCG